MSLDDRLGALTQTVELLVSMHQDNERRMEKVIVAMDRLSQRNARLEDLVTEIAQGTARPLRAAEAHEQRVSRLEEHISES